SQCHTDSTPCAGCQCAYFEKLRSSDSSSVLILACPAASRTRLFDSSCVVDARPRKAYGERNRCSAGFHDPVNSTSFNSLHVFGRSTASLLAVLTTHSASGTDHQPLWQDSHQRCDSRVDAAGNDNRFAGHYSVVA